MQEFEDYLTSKKIDMKAFKKTEPLLWEEWLSLFSKVHPNSFTQQKLFLINSIRRKYPLREITESEPDKAAQPAKPKPKFKIPSRPKREED